MSNTNEPAGCCSTSSRPESNALSSADNRLPARYRRMADHVGGELSSNQAGAFCVVKTVYDDGYTLGGSVSQIGHLQGDIPLSYFSAGSVEGTVPPSELLFFDLETTGLGGAGVVPFLIGTGSLTERGFEVRQYLLPDYSDERAMLEHVMLEINQDTTLVSYNGAAFDLNLLRDRCIINRVSRDIEVKNHIDLLHTTRRLFRRRLGKCNLTNVERELLGFYRKDDIPGYLIPTIYFSWLGEERLEEIGAVMLHNRLDIVTLYFLLTHIASVFQSDGTDLLELDDIYSLSRLYDRRRLNDRVVRLLGSITQDSLEPEMMLFRARALKRENRWAEAVSVWQQLSREDSREGYWANIELAKYYEHRAKDTSRALQYADLAASMDSFGQALKSELRRRQDRLKLKLVR